MTVHTPGIQILPLPPQDSTATIVEDLTLQLIEGDGYRIVTYVRDNPLTIIQRNRFVVSSNTAVKTKGSITLEHNIIGTGTGTRIDIGYSPEGYEAPLRISYNTVLSAEWIDIGDVFNPDFITDGRIEHNTFVFSMWPDNVAGFSFSGGGPIVFSSNILCGFSLACYDDEDPPVLKHNCFYPWDTIPPTDCADPDSTNILFEDPLFCSLREPNWRLMLDSPCIGTGENGTNMGALGVGCLTPIEEWPGEGDLEAPAPELILRYSNPFNPPAGLRLGIPERGGRVSIDIFDATGRHIRKLLSETLLAGGHSLIWDGETESGARVQSGIYFIRLLFNGQVMSDRIVVAR